MMVIVVQYRLTASTYELLQMIVDNGEWFLSEWVVSNLTINQILGIKRN